MQSYYQRSFLAILDEVTNLHGNIFNLEELSLIKKINGLQGALGILVLNCYIR